MGERVNRQRLTEQFLHLVTIDNPSLGERKMADEVERQLDALGISWEEDDTYHKVGADAGNIYAVIEGELPGTPVLFSAHLDSVAPAIGKRAILQEDGRITSAGDTVLGADDLSGVVEIFEVVRVLKEKKIPHRTIELLFSYGEELYDVGLEQFDFSKLRSREAYVLDGSGGTGTFLYKAPSIISFQVQIQGRAAHAGFEPERGIHAILIASEAVSAIQMGRLDAETTVNIGEISGGTGRNIVPERCTVGGEIRSYCHERALKEMERIESLFAVAAERHGGQSTVTKRIGCRAYETGMDSVAVRNFRSVCEKLGYPFDPQESFGASDNNGFAANGIEGIVLACGMESVHSVKEYTTVDVMAEVAEALVELACISEQK